MTYRINYKLLIFFFICLISISIFYFAEDKELFLNFFFLPTIFAGYIYNSRGGVLTAIVSIVFVVVMAYSAMPELKVFILTRIGIWGSFLIISGYLIGALNEKINTSFIETITTLTLAMESRDPYTYGHSTKVSEIATRLAKELRLPRKMQEDIKIAGLLHDIGKFGIREDILRKTVPLTPEEYDHIRQHPFIGVSILSPIKMLKDVIPIIYYHHEHADGKGYLRKKGDEIPVSARILAVADAYDAMTRDRSYRKALPKEEVYKIFMEERGKQFDERIVDALFNIKDSLLAENFKIT